MKRNLLSPLIFAASLCTLTQSIFATASDSFYEKNDIRGFISIAGDYRGMSSDFNAYINKILFNKKQSVVVTTVTSDDTTTTVLRDNSISKYDQFDDYYLGLHLEIGAQYKQFRTWFDVNFMPTQVSERPSATSATTGNTLYDIKWFAYGIDWMFGWKLFGENAIVNLIPAAGFGMNLLNIHFGSDYDYAPEDTTGYVTTSNRYYSAFAPTFNAELELQLNLDPISIGAYGGYRVIRYNEFDVEGYKLGDSDVNGDTWFAGVKLTWTFLSENQRKLRDKL